MRTNSVSVRIKKAPGSSTPHGRRYFVLSLRLVEDNMPPE
jgi:hypothetical protein